MDPFSTSLKHILIDQYRIDKLPKISGRYDWVLDHYDKRILLLDTHKWIVVGYMYSYSLTNMYDYLVHDYFNARLKDHEERFFPRKATHAPTH